MGTAEAAHARKLPRRRVLTHTAWPGVKVFNKSVFFYPHSETLVDLISNMHLHP